MTGKSWRIPASFVWLAALASAKAAVTHAAEPEVHISDVQQFYAVYDAAAGKPSAAALQRDYFEVGTEGLHDFVRIRIESAEALATKIAAQRSLYEDTRACAAVLPDVRTRVSRALGKLRTLLPDPNPWLPPVTILIGRGNTGGTVSRAGVLIALESVCAANWLQKSLDDRLVHLISHEYAHTQQPALPPGGKLTVLQVAVTEGGAEWVAELISGSVTNVHLQQWIAGREAQVKADFLRDMHSTDLSRWFYNGAGTPQNPGDLGYWAGYRIARSFYERAADKSRALLVLLSTVEPEAILASSDWAPAN